MTQQEEKCPAFHPPPAPIPTFAAQPPESPQGHHNKEMPAKTVLITGATHGIGLTFVEHYVAAGWNVIAAARTVNNADKLRELQPYKIIQIDVASEESILQAAKELDEEAIDLLINNAGVFQFEKVDTTQKANLTAQFEVNAVRAVLAHGIAKVVNVTSALGSLSLNVHGALFSGGFYGYRASKAAQNMVTKSLAIDLKDDCITMISVHPGFVATDMSKQRGEVQPKDSVQGMAKVVETMTMDDSGKFLDYAGKELPW